MKSYVPPMKVILLIWVLAVAVSVVGCRGYSPLVTAKIEIVSGTNRVTVTQPKDTTVEELSVNPGTGALRMRGYASAGNVEAISAARAQSEQQAQLVGQMVVLFGQLAAAAGRAYGIPVEAPAAKAAFPQPPPGQKWIIGPGGLPALAPVDDPSTPKVLLLPANPVRPSDMTLTPNFPVDWPPSSDRSIVLTPYTP